VESTGSEEPERQGRKKKTGTGGGYEALDPREVEEGRRRAQQPSEYTGLQGHVMEDLYSVPKKKKSPHHFAASDEADSHLETTGNGELETQGDAEKETDNGEGYERPDPREVEEARMRAQQPSEYTRLPTKK